jgi:hypothetical protein
VTPAAATAIATAAATTRQRVYRRQKRGKLLQQVNLIMI